MSKPRRCSVAVLAGIALFVLVCLPTALSAQYFGRNKVQWEQFDWQVLKTEHFDLYYYPEEEAAVRDTARMAERWYDRLRQMPSTRPDRRRPPATVWAWRPSRTPHP